jgi:hypothetical protein
VQDLKPPSALKAARWHLLSQRPQGRLSPMPFREADAMRAGEPFVSAQRQLAVRRPGPTPTHTNPPVPHTRRIPRARQHARALSRGALRAYSGPVRGPRRRPGAVRLHLIEGMAGHSRQCVRLHVNGMAGDGRLPALTSHKLPAVSSFTREWGGVGRWVRRRR